MTLDIIVGYRHRKEIHMTQGSVSFTGYLCLFVVKIHPHTKKVLFLSKSGLTKVLFLFLKRRGHPVFRSLISTFSPNYGNVCQYLSVMKVSGKKIMYILQK